MDDEKLFGTTIYELRFHKAIQDGLLSDYRVIVSVISESMAAKYLGEITKARENSKLDLYDAGQMIGFVNAIKKRKITFIDTDYGTSEEYFDDAKPMRRAVAFYSTIRNSKFATENFKKISHDIECNHIDGTHNAYEKTQKLHWLAGEEIEEDIEDDASESQASDPSCRVLCNAKCLTEGIDVPNLDAVAFFQPRGSVVDVVQAVGRAIRKAEGKSYGYVILPVVLTEDELQSIDSALKSKKFNVIWEALKALRSHDERLIDSARINEVVSVIGESGSGREAIEATLFTLDELTEAMKSVIPKKLGDLEYWEQYALKVGDIMRKLSLRIKGLTEQNPDIANLFSRFCKSLQSNLNASFDIDEAIALIAQHIITKPIFECIFPDLDFSRFDKVSHELDKLYTTLLDFGLASETKILEEFYTSVRSNAEFAKSDKSKQELIKNLYNTLFKEAFKKTQEKLGIVYTPIEVVDFIIYSLEFVLNTHFGKSLGDTHINIYDPFTGTGTFITRLIQSGLLDSNLSYKYKNELWANEITLLGYYIAQINITATMHQRMQHLAESTNSHSEEVRSATEESINPEKDSKMRNQSLRARQKLSAAIQNLDADNMDSSLSTFPQNDNNISDDSDDKNDKRASDFILLDNLLFTDTFSSYTPDSRGFRGEVKQLNLQIPEYLAKNYAKIQELKQAEFKVILSNPPYSTGQNSANDDNKNTSYPALEKRIADTYAKLSQATNKGSNYDSYKMAIRYASDRIESKGVVAFVTNGSFIDGNADSGLRACLQSEFDYIYIFNLRGNQRTSGELSRKEGGKIFGSGSRTPVAISILVKCDKQSSQNSCHTDLSCHTERSEVSKNNDRDSSVASLPQNDNREKAQNDNKKAKIYYYDIGDYLDRQSKLNIISNFKSIEGIEKAGKFTLITPNKDYDWINQRDYSYMKFMPIAEKSCKFKPLKKGEMNIFEAFSMGISTSRDAWCVNFSKQNLANNMQTTISIFNAESQKFKGKKQGEYEKLLCYDSTKISWSSSLIPKISSGIQAKFDKNKIINSMYRPFCKQFVYYDEMFIHRQAQMPTIYPNNELPNLTICINDGVGNFGALITDVIADNHLFPQTQAFPLYYYEKIEPDQAKNLFDKSEVNGNDTYRRKDAIRDEALKEVQKIYKDESITKEDIFYYIYALLNHKTYKEKYRDNLSKMLPRLPFMQDFRGFEKAGRELAELHLNYESYVAESSAILTLRSEIDNIEQALKGSLFERDSLLRVKAQIEALSDEDFYIKKLAFGKDGKKVQKNRIYLNEKLAIINIPQSAHEYIVNGRSAIEWIIDRYQIKIYTNSQIENNPNEYEAENGALKGLKGGRYVASLLLSVIEMSARTMEILDAMPEYKSLDSH